MKLKFEFAKFIEDKPILVYSCGYNITLLNLIDYSCKIIKLNISDSIIELQIDLDCIVVTSENVILRFDESKIKYIHYVKGV